MIILLVLLPALVLGAGPAIDWKKCRQDENKCMCAEPGTAELKEFEYENAPCAEVGVQVIALSDKSAIFLLQVMNSDASDLGENPELMIYNGLEVGTGANKKVEKEVFGCKLENGKVVLTGDKEHIRRFQINLFEDDFRGTLGDASYFKKQNVLCAIETKRYSKLSKYLDSKRHETQMKLTTVDKLNPKVYKIRLKWFEENKIKCDFYEIGDKPIMKQYPLSYPLRNKDKDELNCDYYGGSYTMRYQKTSGEDEEVKRLECKEEEPGKYSMILVKMPDPSGTPVTEMISKPDLYAVFCAANVGELCKDPMDCDMNSPECPQYHPGGRGVDAKLECPGNKWMINDEYHNLTTKCKIDELRNSKEVAFFATFLTGESKNISKAARCFTDYDCVKKSHVRMPKSGSVVIVNQRLQCNNTEAQLTIYASETSIMNTSSQYTCDKTDGQWKNGSVIVPVNSRASCKVDPKPKPKAEAHFSEGTASIITALVAVGVIALIVILILLGYFFWKRRNNIGMKQLMSTTKNMRTMGRSELIADCKEDFGKFLQATPSSADFILDGLKKIDRMLKEEVEDPYAWEEAYKFLMRFHGSIRLVDRPIWHMFTRYLYLETKKIIDNYGWRTSTPIRNSNQHGLMRTVAIHLLSFSMHDPAFEVETNSFIVAGFRVLGFKGATQYPHAGLLWSLVYHARPVAMKDRNSGKDDKELFDHVKFEDTLNMILKSAHWMNIPVAERIPAFGSIQYQAAFAIGGIPDAAYITDHTHDIVFDKKPHENRAVAMGFFAGLCQSVMHNPIESILSAFRMINPNPKILAMMHDVAPAEEWNKLVRDGERVETYYGRHMDAKRLHERFMPNDKDTDFFKMQQDQKEFLAAVEHVKSDLRHWFAARTDKEEFKQKPVEVAHPSMDLDKLCGDYVPPPRPKAAAAAAAAATPASS